MTKKRISLSIEKIFNTYSSRFQTALERKLYPSAAEYINIAEQDLINYKKYMTKPVYREMCKKVNEMILAYRNINKKI